MTNKKEAGRRKGIYVGLLRGINVGGKNKLPMSSLVALFEDSGCEDVLTYIQSGNVVFRASQALVADLPDLVTKAIFDTYGYAVPLLVRSAKDIFSVCENNPFLIAGKDASAQHVMFLAKPPAPARISALDPNRSPPDAWCLHGRHLYLHLPGGVARTKLTNRYIDTTLVTTSTQRNWRTICQLADLCRR